MPKPFAGNYRQAKRQKELARKTRQNEKQERRSQRPDAPARETGNATDPTQS
jgi:hypothetical protein